MDPALRGPVLRSGGRARPPRRGGSAAGPLVFLALVAAFVVGLLLVARPIVEDFLVDYVVQHDTLLRQDVVRSFISSRVASEVDVPKDGRAESRAFVIARGENAGDIARRLESDGIVTSAL